MGWKGALRSLNAASKRMARDAERKRKELLKKEKERLKMAELELAAYEVEMYENYIDVIQSVHKECGPEWNWQSIKNSSPPSQPEMKDDHEQQAKQKLDNYKPGFFDKLLNRTESQKKQLEEEIQKARHKDYQEYQEKMTKYKQEYDDWKELVDIATSILNGDLSTYERVINELSPFKDISDLGSSLSFSSNNPKFIEAILHVHSENVIPKEVKQLTKSGKLSIKKIPTGRYNELYQDYVCGCVLRVAREIFALLPVDTVYIHALGEILNTKTGHLEERPILSVMIPRQTLQKINFDNIDCSDSMSNFIHNMNFKKTQGFLPVEKLQVNEYIS